MSMADPPPPRSVAAHHLAALVEMADAARRLLAASPEARECAMALLAVVLHQEALLPTQGRDPAALAPFLGLMESSGVFSAAVIAYARSSVAAHAPKPRLALVPAGDA
jgi:hypothetical protein